MGLRGPEGSRASLALMVALVWEGGRLVEERRERVGGLVVVVMVDGSVVVCESERRYHSVQAKGRPTESNTHVHSSDLLAFGRLFPLSIL